VTSAPYELRVAASAERQIARLPEKVAPAVVEFLLGPLCENPHRVGHELRQDLVGLWSARRGAYRVLYEINDRVVTVVRVEHRSDVYRPRFTRPGPTPDAPTRSGVTPHPRAPLSAA
jgi:mRNA interferase RelE/StbE